MTTSTGLTGMIFSDAELAETVNGALERAVNGDLGGGAVALMPLMLSGIGGQYALAAMLASVISKSGVADGNELTGAFRFLVPEQAFAAEFTTAWARGDHETTEALFKDVVALCGPRGSASLCAYLIALFHLAVITVTGVAARQAATTTAEEPTL